MITITPIREADPALVEPICSMLRQLTTRPITFGETELRQIVESDSSLLLILRVDDKVVGMLTLGRYHSPTGRKAWVEDVVIDEAFRGQGLGRRLIDEAITLSREWCGECSLKLTSNAERIAANRLYRSEGFELQQTNLYRMAIGRE